MASAYTILGRQVPAHYLAMLTLGSVAAAAAWPREKVEKTEQVVAPVQTKEDDFDLEKFIKYVTCSWDVESLKKTNGNILTFSDLSKEESK